MADGLISTEPALLEKAAMENWFCGRECPLERMSALECGSRLSNFRSGSMPLKKLAMREVRLTYRAFEGLVFPRLLAAAPEG